MRLVFTGIMLFICSISLYLAHRSHISIWRPGSATSKRMKRLLYHRASRFRKRGLLSSSRARCQVVFSSTHNTSAPINTPTEDQSEIGAAGLLDDASPNSASTTKSATSSLANGSSTMRGRWNWTDTSTFAYGVNLGNCYMLEKVRSQSTETACSVNKFYILQWMNEDLFAKNAPGAVDHWTFECVDLAKNEIELIQ